MQLLDSLKEFIKHSNFPINFIDDVEQYFHDNTHFETADVNNNYFFYAINDKEEVVKLSSSSKNIIGYSQKDLPLNVFDIVQLDVEVLTKLLDSKHNKLTPLNIYRFDVKKKDGSIVNLDMMSLNSYDKQGKYIARIGIAHNITRHIQANEKLHETHLSTIQALSTALELRDTYTAGHMSNTAKLSVELGKLLGFNQERLNSLLLGATIHDIGKIALPLSLLNKTDKLSDEEYSNIKNHPSYGVEIIKNINFHSPVKLMVEQHHERIDGSGYPYGLTEEEIILEAKIIAVADSFDAMTADRTYRKALSKVEALKIIKEEKGTKLCFNVVSKLEELDNRGYLDFHINLNN
jgi:putative nucleotidyltransferase with HDIG domain/PAS domain S-box-containing protein